jgi:hypothetical protein
MKAFELMRIVLMWLVFRNITIYVYIFFLHFDTESPYVASKLCSSCLCLLSAGIASMCQNIFFFLVALGFELRALQGRRCTV